MKKSMITGTGRYLPPRIVTNDDLALWIDTSDEWIQKRTGIEQRHWIEEEGGTGPSDLGLEASLIAMKRAGWTAGDIDLIICVSLEVLRGVIFKITKKTVGHRYQLIIGQAGGSQSRQCARTMAIQG